MILSENARKVLEKRYIAKNEKGEPIEDITGTFRRVAHAVAQAEKSYANGDSVLVKTRENEFYEMMTNLDFLPNSPTLMNAGRPLGQLSACFVLPVGDSMEEIFTAIKDAALIHKSGGGTGFSFSRLRSNGSAVRSTGGVASGPVSFMKAFNAATEAVKQGGTRRGANMGILRIDHPDILEFIRCKNNTHELNNFNISVALTEKFMRAVADGDEYKLVDPHSKKVTGKLDAREVYNLIVDSAWRTGEPGIIFLERMNDANPTPELGKIESTNPCGEQPLLPYEACNLGSINLVNHVTQIGNGSYFVDWSKLEYTIRLAVRFLDDVIDINRYPIPEIDTMTRSTRKIGLGVMGFADMLLKLQIPYNSEKAILTAKEIMEFVMNKGWEMSVALAKERGSFPAFKKSVLAEKFECVRNATVTTIAPTGTLSLIADVSSGIEPVFAYAYIKNILDGSHLVVTNEILEKTLKERNIYTEQLMHQIAEHGSLAHIDGIPDDIKRIFVCAHDVSPDWHVKMQAAFQIYTDNAVSKTVNFPSNSTREDVAKAYQLAHDLGCKGITIYRDGSRESQVLNIGKVNDGKMSESEFEKVSPRKRPTVTNGFTEKVKIGCGTLYVTVNSDEYGVCEVFTNTGRTGGCPSQSEATARLVSVAIRSGVDITEIIDQLKGIRCPSCMRKENVHVTSCPDAIARALEKRMAVTPQPLVSKGPSGVGNNSTSNWMGTHYVTDKDAVTQDMSAADALHAKYCPSCGNVLQHEGGCVICRNCGYSKCN